MYMYIVYVQPHPQVLPPSVRPQAGQRSNIKLINAWKVGEPGDEASVRTCTFIYTCTCMPSRKWR